MFIGFGGGNGPIIRFDEPVDTDNVNSGSTATLSDGMGVSAQPSPWTVRLVNWVAEARSHRVICLVLGIWLLNGFDLTFTILSHRHGLLQEANPVAGFMLSNGTASIILFKIGLVLIGSYPLLRFRRVRLSELAAFLVLAAYVLLAVRWSTCFEIYAGMTPSHLDLADLEYLRRASPQ